MTIKEVYAAIKEEPRQSLLLTDVRQRTEKNAIKGKSAEISSEKTLDLSALLKNKTKYFTEDLFVWFLLAMADMNVAKKSNAQVSIGKIIAKEIITRAGELRGTTFPSTDSQARSATAIKDVVNLHMGSVTLPKRTYNLTDEQTNALIAFMKRIPEIRKNFAKCENLQLFIKNQLA